MSKTTRHPIQPLEEDENGTLRFKRNAIVDHLLEHGQKTGCGLNELACMKFSKDDHRQLAQLIGYSLSGYGDLSYVDDDEYNAAHAMKDGKSEWQARAESLQEELDAIRSALQKPVAKLFGVHPDDLGRNVK